ncbi:MAG TPA: GNAT family N-acetyltransferase [Candidatus Angelobacter sp.]
MPEITIVRAAQEMARLRSLWESLSGAGRTTIFQDYQWNLLALTTFAGREEPWIVCAQASYGLAIVPAVVRHSDASVRLLGEELFDYRAFLHEGDDAVLASALAELATLERSLEVVALREPDRKPVLHGLSMTPFSAAPQVRRADISAEEFAARHGRLARNLRRLQRLGFELRTYSGDNQPLLRAIYEGKADQDARSLFHDQLRIEFLVQAAQLHPPAFEIFTLECGSRMGAALVTLRDGDERRFYTGWFDPSFEKYSPAVTLIYEVTRQLLAAGLDCDYMTGEQPYKMRLATASVPLYRLRATPQQLAAFRVEQALQSSHAVDDSR